MKVRRVHETRLMIDTRNFHAKMVDGRLTVYRTSVGGNRTVELALHPYYLEEMAELFNAWIKETEEC